MKEIIVIERDIEYLKELEREREEMFMTFPEYRTEQVPTNWEELKNLCNENNLEILADIIYTNALSFHKNGDVKDNENSIVAVNRTPAQMWKIIKNLIGENNDTTKET